LFVGTIKLVNNKDSFISTGANNLDHNKRQSIRPNSRAPVAKQSFEIASDNGR